MSVVQWTKDKRDRLEARLKREIADGSGRFDSFEFEGEQYIVGYAQYLLEHLDTLGLKKQDVNIRQRSDAMVEKLRIRTEGKRRRDDKEVTKFKGMIRGKLFAHRDKIVAERKRALVEKLKATKPE